jgi:hypothetical protein
LNDLNVDYKSLVQDRGLPAAIGGLADQIIIDALGVDVHMKTFPHEPGKTLIDSHLHSTFRPNSTPT